MPQTTQFFSHPREYAAFRYAYPVVSRRARGLSIGVNLNPDKVCNWDCPYCQVDRTTEATTKSVDEDALMDELRSIAEDAVSGALWEQERFKGTPEYLRRIRDFALAGDGEPTSYAGFGDVIRKITALKEELGLATTKTVLLTNASLFHLPYVKKGLLALDETPSSVWCKLDAGSEEYFQLVNRSRFSLKHCVENVLTLATRRPVVIQSMFMRYRGEVPTMTEIAKYIEQLFWLSDGGAKIQLVQVYTIARRPSEDDCQALTDPEVDDIVSKVRFALPDLDVQGFYGKHSA
jgi:wyosine [tRNA(Phe)-imidazoG37] synthetase (radical SAM superfamily)